MQQRSFEGVPSTSACRHRNTPRACDGWRKLQDSGRIQECRGVCTESRRLSEAALCPGPPPRISNTCSRETKQAGDLVGQGGRLRAQRLEESHLGKGPTFNEIEPHLHSRGSIAEMEVGTVVFAGYAKPEPRCSSSPQCCDMLVKAAKRKKKPHQT